MIVAIENEQSDAYHQNFGPHQDLSRCDRCGAALLMTRHGTAGCPRCEPEKALIVRAILAGAMEAC